MRFALRAASQTAAGFSAAVYYKYAAPTGLEIGLAAQAHDFTLVVFRGVAQVWLIGKELFVRTIVVSFTLLFFVGCDPMPSKVTVHSEHTSPDGRYVATAFDRDSGATTSWSPQVDLRQVGQSMDKYGNVFIGYGSPNIETKWLSSTQLVVYVDTNCEVDLHATNYYGVTVELRYNK